MEVCFLNNGMLRLTLRCRKCGESIDKYCTVGQYRQYESTWDDIQDIFPDWPAEDRELLISGICSECWEKMFPPEEDEDDLEMGFDPYEGDYTWDC